MKSKKYILGGALSGIIISGWFIFGGVPKLGIDPPVNEVLEARKSKIVGQTIINNKYEDGSEETWVKYYYDTGKANKEKKKIKIKDKDGKNIEVEVEEDFSKKTSNTFWYLKEKTTTTTIWVIDIVPGRQFRKVGNDWHKIKSATTTPGQYEKQILGYGLIRRMVSRNVALADDFYSTTGDAFFFRGGATEAWDTIRTGNGTGNEDGYSSRQAARIQARSTGSNYKVLGRPQFAFDTSALSGTVSAATFSVTILNGSIVGDGTSLGGVDWYITDGDMANPASPANSDFERAAGEDIRDADGILHGDLDDSGDSVNTWTLDNDGSDYSYINQSGTTQLAIQADYDVNNAVAGDPTWEADGSINETIYYEENGSNYPTLTVTLAATDTCTPDGGDHQFNASDNCNIYTDVYVEGSCNFYLDSAGGINIGAKLECEDGCYIDQGFSINIGSTGSFICQQ